MTSLKNGVFLTLAILLCSAVFNGCVMNLNENKTTEMQDNISKSRELGTFEGLDAETEWQILQDYLNLSRSPIAINDLYVVHYYGTYRGYVVVLIKDGLNYSIPQVASYPYQVGGIILPWFNTTNPCPKAWNNGMFYSIDELYASGELNSDELISVASYGYPKEWL